MHIPSLNLKDFSSKSDENKAEFIKMIGNSFQDTGFVSVYNHLLSTELEVKLYDSVQSFFNLDKKVKISYERPKLHGQRGYVSFGKEHAKGSNFKDLKEFWHFGPFLSAENLEKHNYPDNIDVTELPGFIDIGKEAYTALLETGKLVLRAIALYLELDEFYFDKYVNEGNSILRPIHYPPITEEPKGSVRAGQHEDINLITLLMGASADGLEILNNQNEWIPVTALPDHLVINVGDMLQRLTNGKLKSTTHRVVNPPKEKWSEPRYSIPFFLHPISQMDLSALPHCIDDKKNFEDITAGEYLNQRLREIGLIK